MARLLVLAAIAGAQARDTIPLEWGYGTRLLQVRAFMIQGPAQHEATTTTEAPTAETPAVAAIKIVVEAAVAAENDDDVPVDNITSVGSAGPKNVSQAVNHTIKEVIEEAEEEALTNETVAREGAKALSRKSRGQKTKQEKEFDEAVEQNDPANKTVEEQLHNKTIQKAIKERLKEAVDAEVVEKVKNQHRTPSERELNRTVRRELRHIWSDLIWAHRHKTPKRADISFWRTVAFYDWFLLGAALVAFAMLYHWLLDWPSTKLFHGAALLIWVAMAVVYNVLIYTRLGDQPAVIWLVGYALEFIFSIENLFVLHVIVKAFRMPRWITQKVLFIVVLCQITFQWVFYMGLATWLRSLKVLPYILGVWLIYVGCQAIMEDEHAEFDIMKTRAVACVRRLLGDRLLLEQHSDNLFVSKAGKVCVSPAGLLLFCLLLADFLLEVDVTVTKIEGFPSRYICFSSSMVASFALPELFFVARDLFHRFFGLKYGISFVLIFVGSQALLHKLFTLPALTSLLVIVSVILLSIAVSAMLQLGKGFIGTDNIGPRDLDGNMLGEFTHDKSSGDA